MTTSTKEALDNAIQKIIDTKSPSQYDVTIICTTDDHQAKFWKKRLSEGICSASSSSSSKFPLVLAVSEDWSAGGAGNGLGTLYAYQKACLQAKDEFDVDLEGALKGGEVSAALFHTAGKGTRLAPLPASENNNKPGVKLPFCHQLSDETYTPLTVLEAVVKQTGIYAPARKGRLSVYWGDQVFIPSSPFLLKPTHHADIMCTLLGDTAPTATEWAEQGLEKYGVIAVSSADHKNAAQVEKVDHGTAVKMLKSLGDIGQVGPSLGSFSVSSEMLSALCEEYRKELEEKKGKFDTDPHFWMPLTLPEEDYVSLMKQKGVDESISKSHHERMTKMKTKFEKSTASSGMGLFGAVDVGKDAAWWDYGQLKKYAANNQKLTHSDDNSDLLRQFLGVTSRQMNSDIGTASVDDASCVFSSTFRTGSVSNAVVAAVKALDVEIGDGAIVCNCTAKKIVAPKNSILYNLVDFSEEGIVAKEGDVIVSVTDEKGESMELKSKQEICGGKNWKVKVQDNSMTFEEVHGKNKEVDVTEVEKKRNELFQKARDSMGL